MSNVIRSVHASFCDDVRYEHGNKMSLMGIYQSSLLIPLGAKGIIQKLCVVVDAQTPIDDPFEKLSIVLYFNDVELERFTVDDDTLNSARLESRQRTDSVMMLFGTIFILQPLAIESEGKLSVLAYTEREELLSSRLHIKFNNEAN